MASPSHALSPFARGLDDPFEAPAAKVQRFREDGAVKIRGIFPPALLQALAEVVVRDVERLKETRSPKGEDAQSETYRRAFTQVTNLWQESETVRAFVFGKRLARIAADLLGTKGVRLWHDQALIKQGNGGITPWHADQYYWPMATEKILTAWVPLQAVPTEMGPLSFALGSFQRDLGRSLPISAEGEREIQRQLKEANLPILSEPFEAGEVSFHYGWTFHGAPANTTGRPRNVMTVIYMDAEMRLKRPENPNQELDRKAWCPGVEVGGIIASPLNPVLFSY